MFSNLQFRVSALEQGPVGRAVVLAVLLCSCFPAKSELELSPKVHSID